MSASIAAPRKSPPVTVVLTTFNQAQWVGQAVDSVIAQTHTDWELIIIDNGSTDETPGVLARYRADPRIVLRRFETNRRHTVISNEAFRDARGEYICLLYGDDYLLPTKLEKQLAQIEGLPPDFGLVYCHGYRLIDATGELRPGPVPLHRGDWLERLIHQPPQIWPLAPMIRKKCLLEYPYNEKLFMEGEGIFLKIAMRYKFDYLDDYLFAMRMQERNMGREIDPALERHLGIFEDLFAHPDFPPDKRHLHHAAVSWIHRIKGWEVMRVQRRYEQGRRWLVESLRHDRRGLLDPRLLLGLTVSTLPRAASDLVIDLLDRAFGRPPAVPKEFYGA